MKSDRSPFTLTIPELSLALIVGVLASIVLHHSLWTGEPWSINGNYSGPFPDWFISLRHDLFWTSVWPMSIFMALSTIFLLRAFQGNIRYFSKPGHFILAWPLIDFLPLSYGGPFSIYCGVPFIILILSLTVATMSLVKRRHFGNLIAIPLEYWMDNSCRVLCR
jgi:hypothetical protein